MGKGTTTKTGVGLIGAERVRQIMKEGFSAEHDFNHCEYELTQAAVCYAIEACREGLKVDDDQPVLPWPWDDYWWKPEPRKGTITREGSIHMLVKAGALIAAEIDRLQALQEPE